MKRYVETLFHLWFVALIPIVVLPLVAYKVVRSTPPHAIVSANVWMSQASVQQLTYSDPNLPPAQNAAIALSELLQTSTFDLRIARGSTRYWRAIAHNPARESIALGDFSKNVQVTQAGPNLVAFAYTVGDAQTGVQVLRSLINQAPTEIQHLNRQQAVSNSSYYVNQVNGARARLISATSTLHSYIAKHHINPDQMALQSLYDPKFAALYQAVQSAQGDAQNAEQQLSQESSLGRVTSKLQVVDPPRSAFVPLSKRALLMKLGIVVVVCLLLCGALVVVKTALDRSVRFPEEVPELLDLPVLSTVPYSPALARRRPALASPLRELPGDAENGHVSR